MSAASVRSLVSTVGTLVTELRRRNRILFAVTVANAALAVMFTVLLAVDGRTLLGRNVWTKPWKFATSIALFTATLGWLLPSLSLPDRVERIVATTIGGAMTVEILLISTQAARGVASHFNTSTPLDSTLFMVMGVTITISSLVVGYVLWRILRAPPALPSAYRWGINLGMFLFVVASFEGWLMVFQDGHAVGAANDSPGIPLLNWSLTGGDLRIAHFVGLHALQVLPLTGYVAARWSGTSRVSLGLVGVVGGLYSAFTGVTFVQALRGTPFVGPGAAVPDLPASGLAAATLALTACGVVVFAVVWRWERSPLT